MAITSGDRRLCIATFFGPMEENMSISRWITAAAEAALSTAALMALIVAVLLVSLLSAHDTRRLIASEIGVSEEAAAAIPSVPLCFCVLPELDMVHTLNAAREARAVK
jgi:hypothetical protein